MLDYQGSRTSKQWCFHGFFCAGTVQFKYKIVLVVFTKPPYGCLHFFVIPTVSKSHFDTMRRVNKDKKRGKGKKQHRSGVQLINTDRPSPYNPPNMNPQSVQTMRIRYNAQTSNVNTITGSGLLNLMCVATSATTTARIFAAVKIKELEAWSPIRISNTTTPFDPINLGLEWFGTTGSYTNSVKAFSESMGAQSAHLRTRPPKKSSSEEWINQAGNFDNANTIFVVNMPEGGVLDVVFNYVLVDNESASAGPTSSGLTLGTVYYSPLDGRGSNNLLASAGVRQLP